MKKVILSVAALLGLTIAGANAQVSATFKVDMSEFINGGGTINQVVSIAGNFGASGASDLVDWTPASGAMTDEGNNIWSRNVNFAGTATDSLYWKYVKGSDWPDGDEGGSWDDTNPETAICAKKSDNHNRKWLMPASGDFIVTGAWAKCHSVATTSSTKPTLTGLQVFMGPNPTSSTLNIRFGGSANSTIKMVGLDGRVAKIINVTEAGETDHLVNVSDLHAGMYYVTVVDGNKGFKAPVVIVK